MATKLYDGGTYQVAVSATGILKAPKRYGSLETEALFGETVTVLDSTIEYVRVRAVLDGYEGYVNRKHLKKALLEPTHRVSVAKVLAYREPNFKTSRVGWLAMNSLVTIGGSGPP